MVPGWEKVIVSDELVKKFSAAISKAEGFGVPDAIPTKIHNPGNVTDGGEGACGIFHSQGPHGAPLTVFATDQDGWNALHKKVRRMLNGASEVYQLDLTLMEVAIKWSGDVAWARNVAAALGVDTRTSLAQIAYLDSQAKQGIDA